MRIVFVFLIAAAACARQDDKPVVSKPSVSAVAETIAPPVGDFQPGLSHWASPPPAPGDTTPKGFPTEASLLRWVHRYPPDSFPELPHTVRDSLVRRGCQVPLPYPGRVNVITGAFTAAGATEWAVLCSVNDTSQILVINAKNGVVVDSLNRSADSNWIQSDVNNTWVFSRQIALVPVTRLNIVPYDTTSEDVVYYGAALPKPIDHDAIDDAYLDKGSTTFYFAQGHWIGVGSGD